ncbi:MAG TPA: tetratricopeptide repeat protein, partial [Blastocatellia bacterium]|nr:tetratricopeptide repeat protein [Blastocatellia bacterium]
VTVVALAFCVAGVGGRAQSDSHAAPPARTPGPPTFNRDIAPILFQNCAECHHPGGPAPFSLLSYQDVKRRAQQIVSVTQSRYMPPWLPEPGYGDFAGARRLTAQQLAAIKAWAEQGTVEGAPSDLPPAPRFNEGWQLGQPDLVVKMPRPYILLAGGTDVFRNFVIPIPVAAPRFVKAVEILPGNKKVVHHANVLIDRTQSFRRLDEQDPEVGFPGMDIRVESESFEPDSHFLFWKPGTPAAAEPEDMTWRLDKGTDLILNMHLQPSGKPETIQPSIGIYFSDRAPTRFPMLIQLENDGALDIPAGKKDFVVAEAYRLPLDVDVLGIYPHAHYLGKDIQAFATLPDGTKKWLIWIKDWDINWQAVYRYNNPVFLPKGTTISMRYTYDNSADNVRNPNHPPKRVVGGNRSADEMAHLWLQVLPRGREDQRIMLQESLMRHRLEKYPNDFTAHFNLGAALQSLGRLEEAISYYRQALRIKPNDAVARNSLGTALQTGGKLEEALGEYREALRIQPDYVNAHYNLGTSLLSLGQAEEAARHFREVLRLGPEDADVYNDLGSALAIQGDLAQAAAQFEKALGLAPTHADAHYNLGKVFAIQGNLAQAAAHFEQAVSSDPRNADAHNDLGEVLILQGRLAQAATHFEEALRLNPDLATARENLERIRAQLKKQN